MNINQRVKLVRNSLNLSQVKFAEALAISNGYIAGIETDRNTVNERMIKLICFTFHVSETWLRTGEGSMFENSSNLVEIAKESFLMLKPEFQDFILKQIDELLALQNKSK